MITSLHFLIWSEITKFFWPGTKSVISFLWNFNKPDCMHKLRHVSKFFRQIFSPNSFQNRKFLKCQTAIYCYDKRRSRSHLVSIVIRLQVRRQGFDAQLGQRYFSSPQVQFQLWITLRIGGPFSGLKRPGREAEHSHPSITDVKNTWKYISTPHTSSCRGA